MSAKDIWEPKIKRLCMYWNDLQECAFPFSISYGNKEYEVQKEDMLDLRNDDYLEVKEATKAGNDTGLFDAIRQGIREGIKPGKRIPWSSITSIDRI